MADSTMDALRAALESNTALHAELAAVRSPEEAAAVAARHGWQVTSAEIESLLRASNLSSGAELSDEELGRVSGGRGLNSPSVNPIVISRDRPTNS